MGRIRDAVTRTCTAIRAEAAKLEGTEKEEFLETLSDEEETILGDAVSLRDDEEEDDPVDYPGDRPGTDR